MLGIPELTTVELAGIAWAVIVLLVITYALSEEKRLEDSREIKSKQHKFLLFHVIWQIVIAIALLTVSATILALVVMSLFAIMVTAFF